MSAFNGTVFDKIIRKQLKEKSPDFMVYSVGWLGKFPKPYAMEIKGAFFKNNKRVPNTIKRVVIPSDEFAKLVKKHK